MDDGDFRDLQERTQLVAEMAQHPGWSMLVDRARVTLFNRQQRLILGRAKDYEEYIKETAWMEGLSFLMDLPLAIQLEMEAELETRREIEEAEAKDDE